MDTTKFSLLEHCIYCQPQCCKKGSPLLKHAERNLLFNEIQTNVFERFGNFFILNNEPCPFLSNKLCIVQSKKPTVCLAWPINFHFDKTNSLRFIVISEDDCIANNFLKEDFIKLSLALLSEQDLDFLISSAILTTKYGFKFEFLNRYLTDRKFLELDKHVRTLELKIEKNLRFRNKVHIRA